MSERRHTNFVGEVRRALGREHVRPGSTILVALSGGPDSVALLHALCDLRDRGEYRLAAAHMNHGLRGAESDRDEAFCRALCSRLGVELLVERAAGLSPAMSNLEEASRRTRLDFLNRAADRVRADYIATGHHAGDQAETVLMRFLRGAGIAGLAAMAPAGPGRLLRPLLRMDRDQIRAYLDSIGARHVVDSSNESVSILRNRIRHKLLPMLEREYVAGISRRIVELAQEMRDTDQFLDRAARAQLSSMADARGLDLVRLDAVDPALRMRVLRLFIESRLGSLRRIGRSHIEALARLSSSGPANGEVSLPGGWSAIRTYGRLRIAKAAAKVREQFAVPIAFEGTTEVMEAGIAFDASITDSPGAGVPGGPDSAIFDVRALAERGLVARSFRPGDRIRPLGMNGTRKVKDVFIDRKVPLIERQRFPIVASGDEILWLPGVLRAEGARVTRSSETVLLVKARRAPELPY